MNSKFNTIYEMVEELTKRQVHPMEAQLKMSRLSLAKRTAIKERVLNVVGQINTQEYGFYHGMTILTTYSSAVADDFGVDPEIVLLIMLTSQHN